jgi:hypothetical protein
MRTPSLLRRFIAAGLVLPTAAVLAAADEITMTTHYPAPVGIYKRLTATESMVLRPSQEPSNPEEGMLYVSTASQLNIYLHDTWNRVLTFKTAKMGERILDSDWSAYPGWYIAGYPEATAQHWLQITEPAPQSGLYAITWGGKIRLQAETAPYWLKAYGCDPYAYYKDLCEKNPAYCSTANYYKEYCEKKKWPLPGIEKMWVWVYNYSNGTVTYDEYSDIPNDGKATEIDIGGSTLTQMYKGGVYYPEILIYGYYTYPWDPNYAWTTVTVLKGAFIKSELVLPL